MATAPDLEFKVVCIGMSAVGKTCILTRMDSNTFKSTISTVGLDLVHKDIPCRGYNVRLKLWDTAGQERFRSIVQTHTRGAKGVFLVYAVDSRESLLMAKEMHDSMLKDLETPPVTFLVANKTDVTASQRQVTSDQGREQAVTMGVGYLECSAMTGTGIPDLLQYMAEELVRQVESVGTSLPREKIKPNGSSPFSIGRDYPPPKSSESAGGGCNC